MILSSEDADSITSSELDRGIFPSATTAANHEPPKSITITNNNNMNQQQINTNQQMNKSTGATATKSNPLSTQVITTTAAAAASNNTRFSAQDDNSGLFCSGTTNNNNNTKQLERDQQLRLDHVSTDNLTNSSVTTTVTNNSRVSNKSNKPKQNIVDSKKKQIVKERNRQHANASRNRKEQERQNRKNRVSELRLQQYSLLQAISNSTRQDDVATAQVEKLLRRKSLDDIPSIGGIEVEESAIKIALPEKDATLQDRNRIHASRTRRKKKIMEEETEKLLKQLEVENVQLSEHANALNVDNLPSSALPSAAATELTVPKKKKKKDPKDPNAPKNPKSGKFGVKFIWYV